MVDTSEKQILIVDDEAEYRTMVQQYLQSIGYPSMLAASATEALDMLAAQPFHTVISDIRMGNMDGLQLMKEALRRYPHLPFIMMTAHSHDYSFSDIIDAGASDFISKPFPVTELKAKLERIERERTMRIELELKNAALAREAEVHSHLAELSRALLSPLTFESISGLVLECAKWMTDSAIGFAGYIDPPSGDLVCPTMSGEGWDNCRIPNKQTVFKHLGGLLGWVLENRQPVCLNSLSDDPRAGGVPPGHVPIHRFLAAPAIAKNELIGMVALANAPRDYTEEDAMLITRLTNVYALAVDRKWADENLRRTEEELRKARDELQKLVEERTEKLSRAEKAMMRSIDRFRQIAQE